MEVLPVNLLDLMNFMTEKKPPAADIPAKATCTQ